jgi:diadenosine tetraphosphate (Ap4A) HIT family hydrolase
MPSLFTKIIEGEIPGTFVWRDDLCVAFMTIAPLRPGHTLVVPIEEIDHWIDIPDNLRETPICRFGAGWPPQSRTHSNRPGSD